MPSSCALKNVSCPELSDRNYPEIHGPPKKQRCARICPGRGCMVTLKVTSARTPLRLWPHLDVGGGLECVYKTYGFETE